VDRRSDNATSVDVEIDPHHRRLGGSQTDFALQAILECRFELGEQLQLCSFAVGRRQRKGLGAPCAPGKSLGHEFVKLLHEPPTEDFGLRGRPRLAKVFGPSVGGNGKEPGPGCVQKETPVTSLRPKTLAAAFGG